jgi:dTDP-glucose 4,6-dehydratase
MNVLVTGGAGFIGSNFVHYLLDGDPAARIVNFDALTYAGNLENLRALEGNDRHLFHKGDISVAGDVEAVFSETDFDVVVHFAAESHVDRSLHHGVDAFIQTNIGGTQHLLDSALAHGVSRYVQISTDEVYGSLGEQGAFTESSPIAPNNPYAATKAGADFLVRAAQRSHGLDTVITRCSNNYGPCQFPEKLIPLMIGNALEDKPLPVYGDGLHVRDWIYVEDHCSAIDRVMRDGRSGEVYNIGGMHDVPNIHVVRELLHHLGKPESLITYVKDRPGHDRRYAMDATRICEELGWTPATTFEAGLKKTIDWYLANPDWLEHVRSGTYQAYYENMYGAR